MSECIKPNWCREESYGEHAEKCCKCGRYGINYQEGDGKFLHSLCGKCYSEENSA